MNRILATCTLALLLAPPVTAGVVYEIETKDHRSSEVETSVAEVSIEGKNLKMTITAKQEGREGDAIFRGEANEMVVVNHADQTYMVVDEATLQRVGGMANQVMAQMEEALKNVPEDRRAMVEQMMKERMGAMGAAPEKTPTELRKTGETASKNGYPCTKYEVLREGRVIRELWVTDWKNVEGGADVRDAFEGMAEFFQQLVDALPKSPGGGMLGGAGAGDPAFEHMKEIGGFPVVTRELGDDGSLEGETALRSAARRTLDPSEFEPPAGYKRQEMPGGL